MAMHRQFPEMTTELCEVVVKRENMVYQYAAVVAKVAWVKTLCSGRFNMMAQSFVLDKGRNSDEFEARLAGHELPLRIQFSPSASSQGSGMPTGEGGYVKHSPTPPCALRALH